MSGAIGTKFSILPSAVVKMVGVIGCVGGGAAGVKFAFRVNGVVGAEAANDTPDWPTGG